MLLKKISYVHKKYQHSRCKLVTTKREIITVEFNPSMTTERHSETHYKCPNLCIHRKMQKCTFQDGAPAVLCVTVVHAPVGSFVTKECRLATLRHHEDVTLCERRSPTALRRLLSARKTHILIEVTIGICVTRLSRRRSVKQ